MEKVYLCDENFDEYMLGKKLIGKGVDADVYSFGSEVFKLMRNEQTEITEAIVDILGDIEYLENIFTLPTKSVYLNRNFIGFFMKYAGIDLKKYVEKNNCGFEELVNILKILKEKVLLLHKYNIVHGDLQPKNIMIYHDNVKITDIANISLGNIHNVLLNDMTLYLSKYFGITSLLDLHSLNYITYILLNLPKKEMLEYLQMDACGYSYLFENEIVNHVFKEDVFEEQMDILMNPQETQDYALTNSNI